MKSTRLTVLALLWSLALLPATPYANDLYKAVNKNDVHTVRALARNRDLVNEQVGRGKNTPLILAARKGNAEIVSILMNSGANVDMRSGNGGTALIIATQKGFTDIAIKLVSAGADVDAKAKNGNTALLVAAQKGYTEIVSKLISAGADVDLQAANGTTALIIAVRRGFTEIANQLVNTGTDVNAADSKGNTPLMIAAYEGDTAIVRMLIDAKAEVNAQEKNGKTALMQAASGGYAEIVRMLIDANADASLQEKSGKTAFLLAEGRKYRDVALMLVGREVDKLAGSAARLRPKLQVDYYRQQADKLAAEKRFLFAGAVMERILQISAKNNLNIDPAFYFDQALILRGDELHELAEEAVLKYLDLTGDTGEHYEEALGMLNPDQ